MLRKWILIIMVAIVGLSIGAMPSSAGHRFHNSHRFDKKWHKAYHFKQNDVLYMFATDDEGQLQLDFHAAKGKMVYWLWGKKFSFFFKGQNLSPGTSYTLIYSMDTAPEEFIVLGDGTTDRHGKIYFKNRKDTGNMPSEVDMRYEYGAKIILVPSESIYGDNLMYPVTAGEALEGIHLIRFLDIDGCDNTDSVDPDEPPSDIPPDIIVGGSD